MAGPLQNRSASLQRRIAMVAPTAFSGSRATEQLGMEQTMLHRTKSRFLLVYTAIVNCTSKHPDLGPDSVLSPGHGQRCSAHLQPSCLPWQRLHAII